MMLSWVHGKAYENDMYSFTPALVKSQDAHKDFILTQLGFSKGTRYFGHNTREFRNNR